MKHLDQKLKLVLLILTFTFFSLSNTGLAVEEVSLVGQGSSFLDPFIQAMAERYGENTNGLVKISYTSTGSGGGISGITQKIVNFGASDAPLKPSERQEIIKDGDVILHVPITLGGVVVIFNIPGYTDPLKLTGDNVAEIFQGNITNWSDAKLKANNPNLPDHEITVARRSDSSGTTFIFTNYLDTASEEWLLGTSKLPQWEKLDITTLGGNKNAGVAQLVSQNEYSVGYVELGYAIESNLEFAQIQNKNGEWVTASQDTVSKASDAAVATGLPAGQDSWENVSIVDQKGSGVYPISSFAYLLVYQDVTSDGATGAALIAWLKWIQTDEAQNIGKDLSYAPLPQSVRDLNLQTIGTMKYDTTYNPDDYAAASGGTKTSPGFEMIFVFLVLPIAVTFMKKRKY